MVPSASVVVLGMETRRRRGGVGLAPSYGVAETIGCLPDGSVRYLHHDRLASLDGTRACSLLSSGTRNPRTVMT